MSTLCPNSLLCRPAQTPTRARRGAAPRALLHDGHSNGVQPEWRDEQHSSIQHPIFPELAGPPPSRQRVRVPTQRGLPLFNPVIGSPPCSGCAGTGKTTCGDCRGKGRLNYRGAAMLPQGVSPQWCSTCRASGRWCCAKCMGTGVQRQPIGFRITNDDEQ